MKERAKIYWVSIVVLLLVSLVASYPSFAATKPEFVAKLGHAQSTTTPGHLGAVKFAELVAAKTKGRVKINIFPNAQLGSERDLIESQKMGSVEMGLSVGSVHSQFEKSVEVIGLPFLFKNKQEVYKILDGPIGKKIFSVMQKQNIVVLGFFENGFRQLGTNRPINSIADLKGLKLRTPEGDIYLRTWRLLGVNPTPIPWNEVFTALQTKVVDGEEAPLAVFNTSGFGEVTKNFAYINYCYDPFVLSCSKQFWDKLPADLQKAVLQAANEAVKYQRMLVQKNEEQAEKDLKTKFKVNFTRPKLEPFQKAVAPLYKGYAFIDNLNMINKGLGRK